MLPISRRLSAIALICLAAFLLYGRSLDGYFMADDFGHMFFGAGISQRSFFEALSWFWLSREDLGASAEMAKLYRPLSDLSYPLQFLFVGSDAWSYRFCNLLLHAGSACLCMGIVWRLLRQCMPALAAGLFFVLSPAHPESLLWISSRMNLMAGFGILLAVYAFLDRDRQSPARAGPLTMLGVLIAMFSKETGLVAVPLLSAYAFVLPRDSARGLAERLRSSLRATWPLWLLLAGYFLLRLLALGTFLGGYQGAGLFDGEYWITRLHLLLLYLSPVHQGMLPFFIKILLLALNISLAVLASMQLLRKEAESPILLFLLLWMLLSFLPTYAAPFGEKGWLYLQDSRLLYEPSAALAILLGMFCASTVQKKFRAHAVMLLLLVAINGLVAWQNSEPWLRMGRASEAIRQEMLDWSEEDFAERWLVDVPGVEAGAYLFLAPEPILNPAVFPPELQTKVKLLRRSQWPQLLSSVDAALREGRAAELAVYRFSLADLSIRAEALAAVFPCSLRDDLELRYARPGRRRLHAGEAIPIQYLLASPPEPGSTLLAELTLGDQAIATASHRLEGRSGSWLLNTAEDLPAGSYGLRLSLPGLPGGRNCDLGEIQVLRR